MNRTGIAAAFLLILTSAGAWAQQPSKKAPVGPPLPQVKHAPAYPEPFDFKGIRLGMTVSEFKAAPMPVAADERTTPVCTGESDVWEVRIDADEAKAGVVKCAWVHFAGRQGSSAVKPQIVNSRPKNYELEFISKPGDAEPRLFSIRFGLFSDAYDEIVTAIIDRFGKPADALESAVQSRAGAVFHNDILHWANDTGTILAVRRSGSVDTMALVYRLTEYEKYRDATKAQLRAQRGPGL
jgi:hypothetical protein